jgi:hypothetical protein
MTPTRNGLVSWTTEQHLTRIWEELLQVGPISTSDDFFDLGGNSLLVVELADRISEAWQVFVGICEITEHSSLDELCRYVDRLRDAAGHA